MSQNQRRYNVPKSSNQNSNQNSGNASGVLKALSVIFAIGTAVIGALDNKK
jgi:hypothetical protein